jgi:hypothetical protein
MNDTELADRIRHLAPVLDDSDWGEIVHLVAAASSAEQSVSRRPRLRRTWWLAVAAAATAAACTLLALHLARESSTVAGPSLTTTKGSACCSSTRADARVTAFRAFLKAHPLFRQRMEQRLRAWKRASSDSAAGTTGVRTLAAYTRIADEVSRDALPPSVSELISNEETFLTGGQQPTSIQEPISGNSAAGEPSIYLIRYSYNLCMIISLKGAAGSCYVVLRQAKGSIALDDSIVDGKRFIHGLVADNVKSVTVSLTPSATKPSTSVQATIENNMFLAPVPYNGGFALGSATISVTRSDDTTSSFALPQPPRIVAPPSSHP